MMVTPLPYIYFLIKRTLSSFASVYGFSGVKLGVSAVFSTLTLQPKQMCGSLAHS